MGFFDKINPFKKKEDFALPPDQYGGNTDFSMPGNSTHPMDNELAMPGTNNGFNNDMAPMSDSAYAPQPEPLPHEQMNQGMNQHMDPHQQMNNAMQNQSVHSQPLNDHRMDMPIGDSLENNRQDPYNMNTNTNIQNQNQPINNIHNPTDNPLKKDIELISSKLDYLKASLEAVNQRLANIEHMTRQEINSKKW